MKLRYRNTIEDLVAFHQFFYANAPLFKQMARRQALTYFILLTLLALLAGLQPGGIGLMWIGLGFATAVGLALLFKMKHHLIWQTGQNVRKLYEQQPDKTVLGDRELKIVGDDLIERNDYGEFRWNLSAIEEIVETPEHVFLRISSMRAYILPRDSLDPDELESFLDDLERAFDRPEAAAAPAAAAPAPAAIKSEAIQSERRRPWQRPNG